MIDGVDTSQMTRDQLEKFAHNLKNEVEKEREERNYFQLERDQLRTFWEITKNQLGKWSEAVDMVAPIIVFIMHGYPI